MQRWPTLIEYHSGAEPAILILDQTRLPAEPVMVRLDSLAAAAHAIRSMQVRGAPLIGVTAAYGVALGLGDDVSDERLGEIIALLAATRPTAVNLHWALARDTLRERHPDAIDWIERTAMIHEARGHLREAIAWWERTLHYMETEDGFDDEGRDDIRGLIDRLRARADAAQAVTP